MNLAVIVEPVAAEKLQEIDLAAELGKVVETELLAGLAVELEQVVETDSVAELFQAVETDLAVESPAALCQAVEIGLAPESVKWMEPEGFAQVVELAGTEIAVVKRLDFGESV